MPRRPTISDEFRRQAINYNGPWWPQRWANNDGDPPTYEEVLAHLVRLKEMKVETLNHILKEQPGYEEGDEDAPFYSERFLYPLLGKDEARSVLAMQQTTIAMLEALLGKLLPLEIVY